MILEIIMVSVAIFITFLLVVLSLTNYRFGIVWKNNDKIERVSIPIAWFLLPMALGWLWYVGLI